MSVQAFLALSDNLLTVDGVMDSATRDDEIAAGVAFADSDAYINDATVTVTVVDSAGVERTGQSWPAALPYVTASKGVYRATLANGLNIDDQSANVARVTVVSGSLQRYFAIPVVGWEDKGMGIKQLDLLGIAREAGIL